MRSSNNVQNNKPEAALQKNIFKPRAVYAQRKVKGRARFWARPA
jgi:hypothetical protein